MYLRGPVYPLVGLLRGPGLAAPVVLKRNFGGWLGMPGGRVFRALRNYNYRVWAGGALISNIGTWMQRTAQDWLVLTELTDRNASEVGVVMGASLILSFLATLYPSFRAARLDPVEALRYE